MNVQCEFSSDSSLMIRFAPEANGKTHYLVWQALAVLQQAKLPILNLHPAYASLSLDFDPVAIDPLEIKKTVTSILQSATDKALQAAQRRVVEIPVHYGGDDGPDLDFVATSLGLTPEEVIQLHSQGECEVAFLGFAPGFPYLIGLNPRLRMPRKETPRLKVPKGSVAIADLQTGVYPEDSPGGWQILGRTHLELFDPTHTLGSCLRPSDRVRFVPVTKSETHSEIKNPTSLPRSEATLEVMSGGFYSTIQDLGRFGATQAGVSPGGAADRVSHRLANRLVGNSDGSATIEMTAMGGTFRFLKDSWVAITGSEVNVTLDGHRLSLWTSYPVKRGQILFIGSLDGGLRAYLAFAGGIDVAELMNSRSTFVSGSWGGFAGRELRAGDRLGILARPTGGYRRVRASVRDWFNKTSLMIHTTPGPQRDWFANVEHFYLEAFEVTNDVNRRGLRLSGERLTWKTDRLGQELVTEGTANGAIQIPSSGQPLILFCEQQTTGGYPKIANVAHADLFLLGQIKPGSAIRFQETSFEEAWQLARERDFEIRHAIQTF